MFKRLSSHLWGESGHPVPIFLDWPLKKPYAWRYKRHSRRETWANRPVAESMQTKQLKTMELWMIRKGVTKIVLTDGFVRTLPCRYNGWVLHWRRDIRPEHEPGHGTFGCRATAAFTWSTGGWRGTTSMNAAHSWGFQDWNSVTGRWWRDMFWNVRIVWKARGKAITPRKIWLDVNVLERSFLSASIGVVGRNSGERCWNSESFSNSCHARTKSISIVGSRCVLIPAWWSKEMAINLGLF
jgi:hypothetical protein